MRTFILRPAFGVALMATLASSCGLKSQISNATSGGGGSSSGGPVDLAFTAGSIYSLGTYALGSSVIVRLPVQATGTGSATVTSSSHSSSRFDYTGGAYPGTGETCGQPINGNCSVSLVFDASSVGSFSDEFTIHYTNAGASKSLSITITANVFPGALLSISNGATYNYGTIVAGNVASKAFTVTNNGGIIASSLAAGTLPTPFLYKGGSYPGTGGTCGTYLAASTTCTVVVDYAPTAAGASATTLSLSYSDGTNTLAATRAIQGTSAAPALLVVSDAASYNYGNVVVNSTQDHSFTVTNSGAVAATSIAAGSLAAPYAYKGGAYPGTGGDCGTSLAASGTCTIVVTYQPTTQAIHTASLDLAYANGAATVSASRPIQGTGVAPAVLSISDGATYDYGSQVLTSQTDHVFTVSYVGTLPATGVGGSLSGDFAFKDGIYPGTGGTCGTSVSANCIVVGTFTPTVAGLRTSTLTLNYNDGAAAATALRPVQGTGVTAPSLAIDHAATADFGTLTAGNSVDLSLAVTFSGGTAATAVNPSTLVAPYAYKGGAYPGTGGTCGTTIGADCTVVLTFSPAAAGTFTSTFSLQYNNGLTTPTASRPLTGVGESIASLAISQAPTFDYGTKVLATNTDQSFTVTNSGQTAASSLTPSALAAPFGYKGGAYPGTGGTCGTSLAASGTCTVVVTFTPSVAGLSTNTIGLTYGTGAGAATASAARPIQGTGVAAAALTISDASTYDYGSKVVGVATDHTFTVTYTGGLSATSVTGSLTGDFAFKGGTYPGTGGTCAGTVSADCTVVVTFTPSASGSRTSTLTLNYDNGSVATSSLRPVQGTGLTAPTLAIDQGPTADFGSVTIGNSVDLSFTVTFAGGTAATSVTPSVLVAPYAYKGGMYPGTGGTCGTTIGASCSVVISFTPSAAGTFNSTFSLNYDNGTSTPTVSRPLTGVGQTPASLALSSAPSYDFGTKVLATTTDQSFTLTNSGGTTASSLSLSAALTAPFSFAGGAYPGTGGNCGSALTAAGTCTVVVRFNPVTDGGYSDTIALAYNDGVSAKTATRTIIGTGGSVANLTLSDGPTYSFGTVAKNYAREKSFTVTNSGGNSATSIAESTLAGAFAFKGGSFPGTGGSCAATLAAGATCSIVVAFAPTAATSYTGTITLGYNNGSATTSATRGLSGVGDTIAQIVGGGAHTCARYGSGIVRCWGSDSSGQLGDGAAFANSASPVDVSGLTDVSGIAAGTAHTCALLANGQAWCWGSNSDGQLGNGTFTSSGVPVLVSTYSDFTAIAAGGNITCAIRSGGTAVCWGDDGSGSLGNNATLADSNTPAAVSGLTGVTRIAVGLNHACAVLNDATARCWGRDQDGELGNSATFSDKSTPVTVSGVSDAADIFLGGHHSCALLTDDSVLCWGNDSNGELGNDASLTDQPLPDNVSGGTNIATLALGASHTCALTNGGVMKCWGDDADGQLGDNAPFADTATPGNVSGLSSPAIIGTGGFHTCARQANGDMYCWGENTAGQLGDGSAPTAQSLPVKVLGL